MQTININDKIMSRGRSSRHYFFGIQDDFFLRFEGKMIPGLVRIIKTTFIKDGKWSHNTWVVEFDPSIIYHIEIDQDFDSGMYFNSLTWSKAIEELKNILKPHHSDEFLERFIRIEFPGYAREFDKEEAEFSKVSSKEMIEEIKKNDILKEEVLSLIAKAKEEKETLLLKHRNEVLRKTISSCKGEKLSLEELQERFKSLL